MQKRFLTLAAVCIVGASILVPAAMATDEQPPPPPPNGPSAPLTGPVPAPIVTPPPPTAGPCKDDMRPTSKVQLKRGKKNPKRTVHGTARDLSCAVSGIGKVRRVQVSVTRKAGPRCQTLSARGRLSRAASCKRVVWLRAAGTSKWSFRLPRTLPRGTYLLRSRAVDAAGNVERPHTTRFAIR